MLASQDAGDCVMAYARFPFKLSNSGRENLMLDLVARHYLFRALVLDGFEFNKT
jgi:hypothetical protein